MKKIKTLNSPISLMLERNVFYSMLLQHGWIAVVILAAIYYSYTNQILMRGDMIHYIGISIYMKTSHQYLYPSSYLHHLYLEKPPLIFWLINLGWSVFGVNYWWPQVISSTTILSWAFFTKRIYQKVFPNDDKGSFLIPYIIIASIGALSSQIELRVDWIMITCILVFINRILSIPSTASNDTRPKLCKKNITLLTLSIAIGILCKGPIIYLWTLLPCLALRSLDKKYSNALYYAFISSLMGLLIILLAWGLPLLIFSTHHYVNSMLYKTIAGHTMRSDRFSLAVFTNLIFITLPFSLNLLLIKNVYTTTQKIFSEKPLILLTSIPILLFFINGASPWYLLPFLPFGLIVQTRIITQSQQKQTISIFNSCVFSTVFLLITSALIYKCCFHTLASNSFLFHGKMNTYFFMTLAMISFFLTILSLKKMHSFIQYCPLYCLFFVLAYTSIQGYGSKKILQQSNLIKMLKILQTQKRAGKPIIFYLPTNNRADDIISYIDMFELKLKTNYPTVTPSHLHSFINKHPNAILVQKDEKHPSPCPTGLHSEVIAKANLSYHYWIHLCKKI